MIEYRERNGHVDQMSAHQRRCPNCNSSRYVTRVSKEYCPDCKIECDYWGGGINEKWQEYEEMRNYHDQLEREEADRKWAEENAW